MKVAFFFDTVLLKDESNDYYGMTLTYEFFKSRYVDLFENIIVSTRVKEKNKEKNNISGYKKTNGENVEVKPITKYRNISDAITHKIDIKKEIDQIVEAVDKVIIRMPSIIGMFACDSAKKYKKTYIVEMVACPWDGYKNHTHWAGKIIAPIMWFLNRKYVRNAPKVLYVTQKFLQQRYPTEGESISCSDVVLEEFDDEVLKKRIKKIDDMKENEIIKIGTIASVGLKYKGQEFVIKAIARLKKKNKKYEYYLAGSGDNTRLKNIAKKLDVENEIHFLGTLSHKDVFKLIDNLDIYIQPSLQEGLPRALVEAMSKACPAIGSTAGGIPELLDENFIFEKGNSKKLEAILEKIEWNELKKQAERNYNKAKEFGNENLYEKRKQFYKSN